MIAEPLIALLLAAAPAQQSPEEGLAAMGITIAKPMPAEEAARVKARIAAELAKPGMREAFADASDAYNGKLRHKASGLVCLFGSEGQSVSPEGEGALCRTTGEHGWSETRVVRAERGAKLDALAAAAAAQAQGEPGFRPMRGPQTVAMPKKGSGLPEHRTLRWISKADGSEHAIRLQLGVIRGWVLTERSVGPVPAAAKFDMGELLAETMFGHNMKKR